MRKHSLHRISTDAGMQIDPSDLQPENASSSIRRKRECDSKNTLKRDMQEEKHHARRISTEAGIVIDRSDSHWPKAL
jgi:hypothetical protein